MHPSLPVAESCRRLKLTYSWEAWDSSVGQPAQGILMALPNLHTAYKSQSSPLHLFQLLLHLGSVCILVSHLSQPFQLHPYFLWHSFSPSDISAHWIMSQKTQTNTGFTCVNPPSSPWPDTSIAAGFWRARDKTVLYGTGVVGRAGMHLSNTIHPPKWILMYVCN